MDKVGVLLSTYNGEKYLRQQIDSILSQKGVDVTLFVRDDGSSDGTVQIIHEYAQCYDSVIEVEDGSGTNLGVGRSFFTLLMHVLNDDGYKEIEFFSFSDQDDVWLKRKLSRATRLIKKRGFTRALYFSRKRIVDARLDYLRDDRMRFHDDVWDFFDMSNASGCTMVMNRAFCEPFKSFDLDKAKEFLHDAIVFRTAICTRAAIIYDQAETILYRQHGSNMVGASPSLPMILLRRVRRIFSPRDHYIQKMARVIGEEFASLLPRQSREILEAVGNYDKDIRSKLLLARLYAHSGRCLADKATFYTKLLANLI